MNKNNVTKSYLLDELDQILALVGVIFSFTLTIWLKLVIGSPIYVMVGIICFIVCIGYLIVRRFFYSSLIPSLEELRCSARFYMTLNILFFLLLSYSIISIYLRTDPYIRPLGYFISTALMAVIVSNEILFLSPQKSHICFTLFKIIIIGLSLEYSQILIFPSVVGVDPWWHQWFTLKILETGHIPEFSGYSKMPMMHLMIGMTSLVTDLGYKMTTMVSISTLQVISDTLFVFLLGRYLISIKVGLLAALLLEVANYHILLGYWTIPNTMAATLILPIIFIILKMRNNKPFIGNLVLMFLMGTLILTHTISALCLSILLFAFWLSSLAYSRLFNQEPNRSVTLKMCILYTTTMLAYWSFISDNIRFLFILIKMGFSNPLWISAYYAVSYISLWEQTFSNLGMFLFYSLSFIGGFYIMSKQFRTSNRVMIIIGGIVILCLAFIPLILGMTIIAGRWFYFGQILLAIPLSLSILLLNGIFKHRLIKGFLMSISFFILSFILIMSPAANMDNRLFSPNTGIRYAFTESELQAGNTISKIYNGMIGVDWYYTNLFKNQLDIKCISIDNLLEDGDFSKLENIMIIIREETLNHQLHRQYQTPLTINYNPFLRLEEQKYSRIYNCGSASGYLKP